LSQPEKGHGRIDTREITVVAVTPEEVGLAHANTVIMIKRSSYSMSKKKETLGSRIFISSLTLEQIGNGRWLMRIIRAHWDIENRNHWKRDANWREDHTRLRTPKVARILALLRGACLGMIKGSGPDSFDANRQNKRIPLALLNKRSI